MLFQTLEEDKPKDGAVPMKLTSNHQTSTDIVR